MDAQSFLTEELKKIDSFLGLTETFNEREKTLHFPVFSLVDLMSFIVCEDVFYFESKEEDLSFLGLGINRKLGKNQARGFLKNNPHHFLVYQGVFENEEPLIYLPEWVFVKRDGKITLTINTNIDSKIFSPSKNFFNLATWESFVSAWTSYEERPEHDEWKTMIAEADRLFRKKALEKIVLSRKKIFSYDEPIDTMVMFRELYEGNLSSSHYTLFSQKMFNEAFISFTPERLFTLKERSLETISLAGSTLRGKTEEEDAILEDTLKKSEKLIHEHEIVTNEIIHKLSPLMTKMEVSPLFTMKLPYIQHRQARITGVLKKETNPLDLIDHLHPTPAVGGIPSDVSMEKIREIEKEKRGPYAAPMGVLSDLFSEIAVAIRSASIKDEVITVYGGAGIVLGSEAEEEWVETGTKMQPFLKILNKSVI